MEGRDPTCPEGLRPTDLSGALDWWRDAGVDLNFSDTPTVWLAPPEAAPGDRPLRPATQPETTPVEAPDQPFGGDRATWPTDLASFGHWWLNEPSLDGAQVRDRVPPRGMVGAELMILVDQPEEQDTDQLLAGPEGRLLAAFLAAAGLDPVRVYFATVLPRHTPLPHWDSLQARGAGEIVAHHIGLAAPQRLIAFGPHIPPLLGNSLTQTAQNLHSFNHEGRTVPLLSTRELAALMARPAWKAGFWRNWLDWTGTSSA